MTSTSPSAVEELIMRVRVAGQVPKSVMQTELSPCRMRLGKELGFLGLKLGVGEHALCLEVGQFGEFVSTARA
jgi:hypothetical protein